MAAEKTRTPARKATVKRTATVKPVTRTAKPASVPKKAEVKKPAVESPLLHEEPGQQGSREREAVRLFALAAEQHRQGLLDEAVRGYARALALNPRIADAYNNLGVALRAQGKFGAAVACYRRSLALRPDNAGVYSNMGNALREMGRLEAAAKSHQRAVKLSPGSAETIYNLGLVMRDDGRAEEALVFFEKAMSIRPDYPDCRWDRALNMLQRGNYEEGFAEYEWRWKLDRSPPRGYSKPLWDGSDLGRRTILIHQEQGFGDMIQFIRFIPLVKERGGTIIIECQPELLRLFSSVPGVDRVVPKGRPLPKFDVFAPMLSLPRILGTTEKNIPRLVPYLTAPELHSVHLPMTPGIRMRIGLSWAGKPTHRNDHNRSCSLDDFMDLLGLEGLAFFSLQKGEAAGQLSANGCEALITDVGNRFEDFAGTAAALMQLDLVITVDTAIAHLAGALGRPVWVVIPYAPDWRWLSDRTDSPWYPTMRLFRQEKPQDWETVFANLKTALEKIKDKGAATP